MTATVPEDPIRAVARRVYLEFPEVREPLLNPLRRQRLFNLLLPLVSAGSAHSLQACIDRVFKAGYYVSKTPPEVPPRQRTGDRPTSMSGAEAVSFRADSQKAKLLHAFVAAGERGLTAIEACRAAELSERSCYWKRVSELNAGGLIERAYDSLLDTTLTRPGDMGVPREVYVVTPIGEGRASSLED